VAGTNSSGTRWVPGEATGRDNSGAVVSSPSTDNDASQVVGVGAGYKTARGVGVLDGSNPTSVVTGLAHCYAATVTLSGIAAPGTGTSILTTNITGAGFDVYAWKPTSNANPTLIASTGTEGFFWTAIGD
jgi:hypothetical protein